MTHYKKNSLSDLRKTEQSLEYIKKIFPENLSTALNLFKVSAPMFVRGDSGINDDLNGIEKPISFTLKDDSDSAVTIVQSLAKWKRIALSKYDCQPGEGIYTDMRAIRPDETLSKVHSIYVDQWDWEKVITSEQRTIKFLKSTVQHIYSTIKKTEYDLYKKYSELKPVLPEKITFIHTEELEEKYPQLSPKEREYKICRKYGAVFIIGIGADLKDGTPHDGRAPDYDDWTTSTGKFKGLNGDIVVWNPILKDAYEISSMGIRVDKKALARQLKIRKAQDRKERHFHQMISQDKLPLSIGGGIGQSRLCMFLLRKHHIGQVQSSLWDVHTLEKCQQDTIQLL